jgi:hypothetical protein
VAPSANRFISASATRPRTKSADTCCDPVRIALIGPASLAALGDIRPPAQGKRPRRVAMSPSSAVRMKSQCRPGGGHRLASNSAVIPKRWAYSGGAPSRC